MSSAGQDRSARCPTPWRRSSQQTSTALACRPHGASLRGRPRDKGRSVAVRRALAGGRARREHLGPTPGARRTRGGDGQLRFRNTLISDAAYEGLPFRRRRALHARIADAIVATAGEDDIGALALHYSEAGHNEKAWRYCLIAGDKASEIYANVEAASSTNGPHGRANGIGPRRERAAAWTSLGSVLEAAGLFLPRSKPSAAQPACCGTTVSAGEALRIASAVPHPHGVVHRRNEGDGGRASARRVRHVEDCLRGPRVLGAMRCEVRWQQGHPREAIEIAKAAIRDAKARGRWRRSRGIHRDGRRISDAGRAGARGARPPSPGDPTETRSHEEAATIESNLGVQAYSEGRWDEAVAWYRRAQEHSLESGDLRSAAVAGSNLAEVLVAAERPGRSGGNAAGRSTGAARLRKDPFALLAEMQQTRIMIARGELERQSRALSKIFDEAWASATRAQSWRRRSTFAHALAEAGDAASGPRSPDVAREHCRGRNGLLRRPDRPGRGNLPGRPRTIRRGPCPDRDCRRRGGATADAVRAAARAQERGPRSRVRWTRTSHPRSCARLIASRNSSACEARSEAVPEAVDRRVDVDDVLPNA